MVLGIEDWNKNRPASSISAICKTSPKIYVLFLNALISKNENFKIEV